MPSLEIFVCKNSNSLKHIYGNSSSGDTRITKITEIDIEDRDILFHDALFNSSDDLNTIVLFNDMETVLSPTTIMNYLEKILALEELDLFYLYKTCDVNSLQTNVTKIDNIYINKLISPHGIEGLILTPKGKKILRSVLELKNGRSYDFALNAYCEKLNAYSSNPLFFIKKGPKKLDNVEDREKSPLVGKPKGHTRNKSMSNFIWFLMSVVIIIVVAVMLLSGSEKITHMYDHDEENDFNKVDKGTGIGPFDPTGDLKSYRID